MSHFSNYKTGQLTFLIFQAALGAYNKNGKPIIDVADVDSVYSLPKSSKNNKNNIANLTSRDSYY